MNRRHELPFGAEVEADGVRFRLWAPRAAAVLLQLEGDHPTVLPMAPEDDGWFALTTACAGPGARYRYIVDGTPYPDPASRRQPEGVHGPSEVVDPRAYNWSDDHWRGRPWEEIVLYELHLGTFSASGDFTGAIPHLDHLRRLGVTAIELMPIAEFPGRYNWGYDGAFLYAPCSRYGPPNALKALIEACHARGIAVLLDVVYNHFGPEGNYLTAIAPDFFTDRHNTPWGAAINFSGSRSRTVRDFVVHNALYWLEEYHFDGLRLDAVHAIFDDSRPDIVDEIGATVRRTNRDRPIHLVLENDRKEPRRLTRRHGSSWRFTAQWANALPHALHELITGERVGYSRDDYRDPAVKLGRALTKGSACQDRSAPVRGTRPRGKPSAGLWATSFVAFLQNHDQIGNHPFGARLAARAAEPALHAGIAIILLSPQIPLLFMGEEWASLRPFAFFCDFEPRLAQSVREGRRREFYYSQKFRSLAAGANIPDPTAQATFTMSRLDWEEAARNGHARWLERYRALIGVRAREIVPRLAEVPRLAPHFRLPGPRAVTVEWRLGDGTELRLVANFSDQSLPSSTAERKGRLLYSSAEPGGPVSASFFLMAREGE